MFTSANFLPTDAEQHQTLKTRIPTGRFDGPGWRQWAFATCSPLQQPRNRRNGLLGAGSAVGWLSGRVARLAQSCTVATPFICNDLPSPSVRYVIERTRLSISAVRLLGREPRGCYGNTGMDRSGGAGRITPGVTACLSVLSSWSAAERICRRASSLDHAVKAMRLRFSDGLRAASSRKIPSVAYTPRIICSYSGWFGWQSDLRLWCPLNLVV